MADASSSGVNDPSPCSFSKPQHRPLQSIATPSALEALACSLPLPSATTTDATYKANKYKANKYKANKDKANKYKANKDKANKDKANKDKANKYKANKYKAKRIRQISIMSAMQRTVGR